MSIIPMLIQNGKHSVPVIFLPLPMKKAEVEALNMTTVFVLAFVEYHLRQGISVTWRNLIPTPIDRLIGINWNCRQQRRRIFNELKSIGFITGSMNDQCIVSDHKRLDFYRLPLRLLLHTKPDGQSLSKQALYLYAALAYHADEPHGIINTWRSQMGTLMGLHDTRAVDIFDELLTAKMVVRVPPEPGAAPRPHGSSLTQVKKIGDLAPLNEFTDSLHAMWQKMVLPTPTPTAGTNTISPSDRGSARNEKANEGSKDPSMAQQEARKPRRRNKKQTEEEMERSVVLMAAESVAENYEALIRTSDHESFLYALHGVAYLQGMVEACCEMQFKSMGSENGTDASRSIYYNEYMTFLGNFELTITKEGKNGSEYWSNRILSRRCPVAEGQRWMQRYSQMASDWKAVLAKVRNRMITSLLDKTDSPGEAISLVGYPSQCLHDSKWGFARSVHADRVFYHQINEENLDAYLGHVRTQHPDLTDDERKRIVVRDFVCQMNKWETHLSEAGVFNSVHESNSTKQARVLIEEGHNQQVQRARSAISRWARSEIDWCNGRL